MISNLDASSVVLFGVALVALLVLLSNADLKNFVLPDQLNLALAVVGIAQSLIVGRPDPLDAFLGSLLCGGILLAAARLYLLIRGRNGLGFGDQKFGFAAGFWIGWQQIPSMLLIASTSALLFVFAIRLVKRPSTTVIPFGPFLSAGVLGCWLLQTIH